ncbi:hypothetical protein [Nonlabens marinus]|uniref:Uncharacterized protein n=1 Tax=Nonlabens marinus S1-08 TaxID=1454201 RepID=W8VXW8_9FLAO|nr:hypothetical protein [Nonlabens marinus]BAO56652.1 hypothetical protein NMS_2643 [Nonlabens marinus S1-08]
MKHHSFSLLFLLTLNSCSVEPILNEENEEPSIASFKTIIYNTTQTPPLPNSIQEYVFDAGKLSQINYYDRDDLLQGTKGYAYEDDRISKITYSLGSAIQYTQEFIYENDNLVNTNFKDGSGTEYLNYTYSHQNNTVTFDEFRLDGNAQLARLATGTMRFDDDENRLSLNRSLVDNSGMDSQEVDIQFDSLGNVIQHTDRSSDANTASGNLYREVMTYTSQRNIFYEIYEKVYGRKVMFLLRQDQISTAVNTFRPKAVSPYIMETFAPSAFENFIYEIDIEEGSDNRSVEISYSTSTNDGNLFTLFKHIAQYN